MMRIKKLWLSMIAVLWCSITVGAYDFEVGGIYYNITSKAYNKVGVTRGDTNYSGSITIPATVTYEGVDYNVTSIGTSAFAHCSSLTSITIPESVTSIEYSAFYNCSSLTAV